MLITISISGRAHLHCVFGFGDFRHGGVRAQRKADDGADFDWRSGELRGRQGHPIRIDTDACEAVFTGLTADLANVGSGGVGAQQGMIDLRGERRVDARQGSQAETREAPAAKIWP